MKLYIIMIWKNKNNKKCWINLQNLICNAKNENNYRN